MSMSMSTFFSAMYMYKIDQPTLLVCSAALLLGSLHLLQPSMDLSPLPVRKSVLEPSAKALFQPEQRLSLSASTLLQQQPLLRYIDSAFKVWFDFVIP